MSEFTQLEQELLPVFAEIERIKEKHRITSLTLESFNLIDQFHGSHGVQAYQERRTELC